MNKLDDDAGRLERRVRLVGNETMPGLLIFLFNFKNDQQVKK